MQNLNSYIQIGDTDYTIEAGQTTVGVSTLTATRTLTLPAASSAKKGDIYTVVDESGDARGNKKIDIAPAGSDTINKGGSTGITRAFGSIALYSDGLSGWFITRI